MADARYAGLTYASIAGDHGAGGWQVHSRSPTLGAEDEALLTDRVVTGFDSHLGALPQFVEPEALAALPVRFSAEPGGGGTVILHAVQAGTDATGRPGNVFTTVLLDRRPGTPPLPIRLWRSPDLLAPFGAAEVTSAVPRWDVQPGTGVDASRIAAMVTDPDRWALLAVLLDAVAAAAAGGLTVVLRARDQDEAARWIGAVCLLTTPAWSARLRWSLYERADAVDGLRRRGLHLVVVPAAEEPMAWPDVVVLDADEQPALGVLGATDHVTGRGHRVRVTGWSDLVTELFPLDTEDVAGLVQHISSAEGPAAGRGEPAWWLAAGLLGAPACPPDLAAAAAAMLRGTPAPAGLGERDLALLDGALGEGLQDVDDLRRALDQVVPEDTRSALLADRFVLAALRDPSWLDAARSGAPMTGSASRVDRDAVAAALRAVLTDADGVTLLHRLGSVLDVLRFAGLLDAADPRIDEPLAELVLMAAAELDPEHVPDLVAALNRLPGHLRSEVLPMVAGGPLGAAAGSAATTVELPADLRSEQVLELLDAADGGVMGLAAADALLARGPDRIVAHRVGALLAASRDPLRDVLRSLHVDGWDVGDRLILAAARPEAQTDDQLVTAIGAGAPEDVRVLEGVGGLTDTVLTALHLRLRTEDALIDEHWRVDLDDDVVLRAADRLAGGSRAAASAVLAPRMRLLPVIALLIRRLRTPPAESAFEVLLRRRALGRPLDPLPADAVTLLADRLQDPMQLPAALAFAASDRAAASNDPLRRGLRSEEGDLLDAALVELLPQIDADRAAEVVAGAETLVAGRSDASRLDRLLARRTSPVADYLDDRGLDLTRKVR